MDIVINSEKKDIPLTSNILASYGGYRQNILACFDQNIINLPIADLLCREHNLSGQWIAASAIHWEASHNDAMITATSQDLEINEKESKLFFQAIAKFLEADGFKPIYHDAQTWLFNIENKPAIKTKMPQALLHQSLMPVLEVMDKSGYWPRLITELQMFLSSHPLNLARANHLAINGLWFWGSGELNINTLRPIATNDETIFSLIKNFCPQISYLTDNLTLEKNHLLIINNFEEINLPQLEKKVKKYSVNWYWSNLAYTVPQFSWWSSLLPSRWRK